MENLTNGPTKCPRCEKSLPPDAAEGLCPACLVAAGMETMTGDLSEAPTMISMAGAPVDSFQGPRFETGTQWGPYRIGRLLGKGGMGEVYEAEHSETGRRVALKILRGQLHHAEDRSRFLREGQLAASISHPHTVYIFGSEEISGSPVISMELLPGGTLKDRVADRGPLPPAEAVSAILDIIGGLDAAHAAGVLHRDIKPSNCFIDSQGAVKVGDFGLSISTLARDVHNDLDTSTFQGTPQFAPPEQLRGEPLDVRADIYAVGATLYYLLTGQPVFDAKDLRELLRRATSEPAKSPRRLRPDIPAALSDVVLRCLAKNPSERPGSYAVLADALRPFTTTAVPAGLGLRFIASMIDSIVVSLPVSVWIAVTGATLTVSTSTVDVSSWIYVATLAYYLVSEGFWKASLGKRLFHLRVVSTTGSPVHPARIGLRTLIFFVPNIALGVSASMGMFTLETKSALLKLAIYMVLVAVMFMTARSRNGYAGIHEVLSATRVVSRADIRERRLGLAFDSTLGVPDATPVLKKRQLGPFSVVSEIALSDGQLWIAVDPILRRHVWIRPVPAGSPLIGSARRDVSRSGRLHWLTGRRSPQENWDAFEAPSGAPFLSHQRGEQWATTKVQLLDLSEELSEATKDSTLPQLNLDRLWTRADGRILLLDFPAPRLDVAPGRASHESDAVEQLTAEQLLSAVTSHLTSNLLPNEQIPLSARTLVTRLTEAKTPALDEARKALASVVKIPDHTSRWRRAIPIALAAAPIVLLMTFAILVLPALFSFMNRYAEMLTLLEALHHPIPAPASRLDDPEVRNATEIYLVGRYGETLRADSFWKSAVMQNLGDRRRTANAILERHPHVSAEELARATEVVEEGRRQRAGRQRDRGSAATIAGPIVGALGMLSVIMVLGLSLVSSLIVPGGLLARALGLAVVTRDGLEVTRARSFVRTMVAWAPALVWLGYLFSGPKIQGWVPAGAVQLPVAAAMFGVLAIGAIWSIVTPSRGPHDRVVGTWIVPR